MLDDLLKKYEYEFDEVIELPLFLDLDDEEKTKILKQCLESNTKLYENDYFNDNYMEEVID